MLLEIAVPVSMLGFKKHLDANFCILKDICKPLNLTIPCLTFWLFT